LTRAMLQPLDRIAWLAVLRAPWCGLTVADLEALVRGRETQTIRESLRNSAGLSADGATRAARLHGVLAEALDERGRWPLRRWVERVWIRLGGPACLEGDVAALRDASDFLDLLEAGQSGADLADFDRFRERVHELYAQPSENANPWLQVMTIHKAKGLEFDTVILPGLGQRERPEDARLFLFHQWKDQGKLERLLAPIPPPRESDPIYTYLQGVEKQKSRYERARQLYVAVTRARKRLHLLGQVRFDKTGQPSPHGNSMLADLWPVLTPQQQGNVHRRAADPQNTALAARHATSPVTMLRRLPCLWTPPAPAEPMPWERETRDTTVHEPAFEWVGETLRHTGTVVHAFLQRMAAPGAALPEASLVRKALLHEGVSRPDLDSAAKRVLLALEQIRVSERARWIFAIRPETRREFAVTGVLDGEIVRGKVDRTFVDADGVRWIVDYKTSAHEGSDLDGFLDEQQRRYRDQLERYARLLRPLGQRVRLGLYFPLMDAWREWE
jgi:ATP-dependent helicase/nuclease subunit A